MDRINKILLSGIPGVKVELRRLRSAYAKEVTARKRAESLLKKQEKRSKETFATLIESEHRYHSALDNMLEGCQIISFDWRYLYVNQAAANHARQPVEKLLSHTIQELYPGIEGTRLFTALSRSMFDRITQSFENEFTYPDGSKAWFDLKVQPTREGIFILTIEITKRKLAEKALLKSEESLKQSQLTAHMGDWEFDLINKKTRWSEGCYLLLGFRPFEMEPTFEMFMSRVHPDDRHLVAQAEEKVMATKAPAEIELRVMAPGGEVRWILNRVIPHFEGDRLRVLKGINMDITHFKTTQLQHIKDKEALTRSEADLKQMIAELVQAKENAERAEKLKSAFLANMSHEVRTPLNAILGFTNMLVSDEIDSQEEKEKFMRIINKSAEGLLQIINDVLDASKLETGQVKIYRKPFYLNDMLSRLFSQFRKRLDDEGKSLIRFSLQEAPRGLIMSADENRLSQVFNNLLNNAVKFTHKGQIIFGLSQVTPDKIEFVVSDTGIGIPETEKTVVFERFRQVTNTSRLYGGNGLGLTIAKNLTELMGGGIGLDSEEGKGTTFRFYLPFKSAGQVVE